MEKDFGHLAENLKVTWALAFVCVGLLAPVAMGQTVPIAPPNNVEQCLSCHGPLGKPEDPSFPIIGGQYAEYLVNALRAYQQGLRTGQNAEIMTSVLQGLQIDETAIQELAHFFSSLRPRR